jgi:hypothetical protein
VAERVSSCVWRISDELILAIDARLGEPTDAYVNGSHTWFRDDGPAEAVIEWRLHPVAGFSRPKGVSPYELWERTVWALRTEEPPPAPVADLWEGLEAFPGFGDDVEPAPLAASCAAILGLAPDAYGVVDHDHIGDAWEASEGRVGIVAALIEQLGA